MRLGTKQHAYMAEALRRFECFAHRRDGHPWTVDAIRGAWIGLGFRSEYGSLVSAGLMETAPGTTTPASHCMGWWSLTERGARIILAWHHQGYSVGDGWELERQPPFDVPGEAKGGEA